MAYATAVMALSVIKSYSPIASLFECDIYIRQVNGVNWRISCDALISFRPSVDTEYSQGKGGGETRTRDLSHGRPAF